MVLGLPFLISFLALGHNLRDLNLIFFVEWLRPLFIPFPKQVNFVSELIDQIEPAIPPLYETDQPDQKQHGHQHNNRVQKCLLSLLLLWNIDIDHECPRYLAIAVVV